jgi:D-arabinose 1-dehydrogenase-like Zn-dependent alcohol dehydrogenase
MIDMAKAFGAETFAVERDPDKLAQLREAGAGDHVIDAGADGWDEALREASDGGVHACIDTVGGDDTIETGVAALRRAGVLVVLGFRAGVKARIDPTRLMLEEITVTGTRYATRTEIAESLAMVGRGLLAPRIGARFPLWQLNEAFEAINANRVFGRILIDRMGERPPG